MMLGKGLLPIFLAFTAYVDFSKGNQGPTYKDPKSNKKVYANCPNFYPKWDALFESLNASVTLTTQVLALNHAVKVDLTGKNGSKNVKLSRYLSNSKKIRDRKFYACLKSLEVTMISSNVQYTNVEQTLERDLLAAGAIFQPVYNCVKYQYEIKAQLTDHEDLSPKIYERIIELDVNKNLKPELLIQYFGLTEVTFKIKDNNRDCKHLVLSYRVSCDSNQRVMEGLTSSINNTIIVIGDTFIGSHLECYCEIDYEDGSIISKTIQAQIPAPIISIEPVDDTLRISGDLQRLTTGKGVSAYLYYREKNSPQERVGIDDALKIGLGKLKAFTRYEVCLEIRKVSWQYECTNPSHCYRDCQQVQTNPGPPSPPRNLRVSSSPSYYNELRHIIRWDEPTEKGGLAKDYVIVVDESCVSVLSGCTTDQCKRVVFNTTVPLPRQYKYVDLRNNYEYHIRVYFQNRNHRSDPTETTFTMNMKADLKGTTLSAIPGTARDFLISLIIPCETSIPANSTFDFYSKTDETISAVELAASDATQVNQTHVQFLANLENFTPNKIFSLCVRTIVNEDSDQKCVEAKSPEEAPVDPPTPKRLSALASESFHLEIEPPARAYGKIINYTVSVAKKCRLANPGCPALDGCSNYDYYEKVAGDYYTAENNGFLYIKDLTSYTDYQFIFKAVNRKGSSPGSSPFFVTTCADLTAKSLLGFNFTVSTGDTYINANIKPICAYVGSMKFQYEIFHGRNWIKQPNSVINYDPKNSTEGIHIKYLKPGLSYKLCVSLTSVKQPAETCPSLDRTIRRCQNGIITKCDPVPPAENDPVTIPFQVGHTNFNPFTSIKVLIPANTFIGPRSAIHSFKIVCPKNGIVHSKNISSYDQDSTIILPNVVKPSLNKTTYVTILVRAIGCNNTKSDTGEVIGYTIPLQNASLSIDNPDKEMITEGRTHSPNDLQVKVTLTESVANIKYWKIKEYQIGKQSYNFDLLFDKNTGSINRGKKGMCKTSQGQDSKDPMKVACHMILSISKSADYLPMSMAFIDQDGLTQKVPLRGVHLNTTNDGGLIGGLVGGILIMFALTAVIVFFIIKRRKKPDMKSFTPVNFDRRESVPRESVPLQPSEHPSRSLTLDELVAWVQGTEFAPTQEYKKLTSADERFIALVSSKQAALKWSDKAGPHGNLNRYGNVMPYDHSRVILQHPLAPNQCDFINANWIRGEGEAKSFIAAQGPLERSTPHFWQMVMENDVALLVMLTKLKEKKIIPGENDKMVVKCFKYWPDNGKSMKFSQHGLEVEATDEFPHPDMDKLIIRHFKVTNSNLEQSINVTQMQYSGWPDHGVPNDPKDLLRLHEIYRSMKTGLAPAVIHCSAGVGRTGTLIALETIASEIDQGATSVDVFRTVYRMREDRPTMVQKAVQYGYLYQCVAAYIEAKRQSRQGYQTTNGDYYYDEYE